MPARVNASLNALVPSPSAEPSPWNNTVTFLLNAAGSANAPPHFSRASWQIRLQFSFRTNRVVPASVSVRPHYERNLASEFRSPEQPGALHHRGCDSGLHIVLLPGGAPHPRVAGCRLLIRRRNRGRPGDLSHAGAHGGGRGGRWPGVWLAADRLDPGGGRFHLRRFGGDEAVR